MQTHCTPQQLSFQGLGGRRVEADFDGGEITSDAGALLLREVSQGAQVLERFAACFYDYRNPLLIEHSVLELVSQRTYALALGCDVAAPRAASLQPSWQWRWMRNGAPERAV